MQSEVQNKAQFKAQFESQAQHPSPALRCLLAEVIDYAGLFPPANLSLATAVGCYSTYRLSPHSWMLGRFIVPASRLPELQDILHGTDPASRWKFSALLGKDYVADIENITRFNQANDHHATVDVIEAKSEVQGNIEDVLAVIPAGITTYFEVPLPASSDVLSAIKRSGGRIKVRTGGLVSQAIPEIRDLAEFLVTAVASGIHFKATAGLHHPIRSFRALTYEVDAPSGEMHGFVNLLTASAIAMSGASVEILYEILADRDASSFVFTGNELHWRDRSVPIRQIQDAREDFVVSFGSCSIAEPIEDLSAIGWL